MYDPNIHHRRSLRIPHFDYTSAGVYFVTICVQDRMPLLGTIVEETLHQSSAGMMAQTAWEEIPEHYPGVGIDAFVAMPNHVHGLLTINHGSVNEPALSLSEVMQRWKSWTTTLYRRGVNEQNWPPFPARLWQRNYYERVVRDEKEWQSCREYIRDNSVKWCDDQEYTP